MNTVMKYKIKVYSIWEFGQRKDADGNPHQEDCTYPLPKELNDSDRTFILCDGMGGHDAGEVASATVCQAMGHSVLNDGHDADGVFSDEDLDNAIQAAFRELDGKDNGAEKKMGTTMTFLKLHNDGATIAHMGDSRVYHIRPGKDGRETQILFETRDHSLVNDLVKAEVLTKEEARHSKQRNVITRAMQPHMERHPKADIYHTSDIKAGDWFYMCSDGMLEQDDMESGESLRNIFSDAVETAERKVEILTEVTEDNKDNHTALLIHIEEVTGCEPQQDEETDNQNKKRMGIVEDEEIPAPVTPVDPTPKRKPDVMTWIGMHKKATCLILLLCLVVIGGIGGVIRAFQNDTTETYEVNGVSFDMVLVEGGTFTMGATPEQGSDADSGEKPAHQVTLSSFMIGKYEVTQALWTAVMGSNPSSFKGDNLPVECVSWNDCQTFIKKLNSLTGKNFRLPTEAEWEYAARGGNKSRGYKYAGSNNIDDVAWYDGNSSSKTHAVGTKQPNELGLCDMNGNVWEWCGDRKESYRSTSQTNPTGATLGSNRVSRGGSWHDDARYCRMSDRHGGTPAYSNGHLGLRLALPVQHSRNSS